MRQFLLASTVCLAMSVGAAAQSIAPQSPPDTPFPAPNSAAVPGDNSFTESQVRERLEANGYSGIGALTKGEDGIWRTTATHSGQHYQVAMDYRGNIVRE